MWVFLKIGLRYIIVLSLCYGDFNLSLHDVVTCSSKPNLTGNLAVYSIHRLHFFAYIFMHTLKYDILNLNLSDKYRPLANSFTFFL